MPFITLNEYLPKERRSRPVVIDVDHIATILHIEDASFPGVTKEQREKIISAAKNDFGINSVVIDRNGRQLGLFKESAQEILELAVLAPEFDADTVRFQRHLRNSQIK